MLQIDIDFDVFKALTAMRESENHTYNDVIRGLLGLPESMSRRMSREWTVNIEDFGRAKWNGFISRDLFLPNGTELRANYKGNQFTASIQRNKWIDSNGAEHDSPSAAASAITGTNVNGLRFWEAKRPSDSEWRKLDALPKSTAP